MTCIDVPVIDPGAPWTVASVARSPFVVRQVLARDTARVAVVVERAVTGGFREAYPAGEHDLRIEVETNADLVALTELLGAFAGRFGDLDPQCRRMVYAAPEGDVAVITAAEQAGFRYVVDVDVSGGAFSLMVAEPVWVTAVDMDLDRVPQT